MRLRGRTKLAFAAVLALAVCALTASAGTATGASAAASSLIPISGTGSPQTGEFTPSGPGDVTTAEFAGQGDGEGADAYNGNIVDRSLSTGSGNGVSVNSGKKAKSNPTFNFGFEGLNHYQQRYSRGGNQFSVEPPDQGMCAGNGYVVEAVNDVFNVFNAVDGRIGSAGQHRDEHRRGLPEEREPRGRPELVLRVPARDQPVDRRAGAVRDRPELPL